MVISIFYASGCFRMLPSFNRHHCSDRMRHVTEIGHNILYLLFICVVLRVVMLCILPNWACPIDHSPIRQTFELGKFISTADKSILNLVRLRSLVTKYCKMWKIQSCEVCKFRILLYAQKSVTTFRNVVTLFRAKYKSIQNSQTCIQANGHK